MGIEVDIELGVEEDIESGYIDEVKSASAFYFFGPSNSALMKEGGSTVNGGSFG